MIGVVVVAHGALAGELVRSAELIVGPQERLAAVGLEAGDDVDATRKKVGDAIKAAEDGNGVLVLTDMFGGTPCNMALTFHEEGRVEILTGVNLPMLLKAASSRIPGVEGSELPLRALATALTDHARKSIQAASDILRR